MDTKMLTVREVYEVLRGVSVASRSMRRITTTSWDEIYCGLMTVDVDGWVITFFNDCGTLDYCDSCFSPEGRKYDFSSRDAFDPVELLAPEEHRQLEEMLRRI
ncbi:hypothetical protein [Pseudomonas fluorescens]|nr:hypothetical protein [Pseudomonas fluorescens]